MSHISTAVESAMHCLLYLVSEDGEPPQLPIKDIAEMQGVSAQYLAKIFTKLRHHNLVEATEGTKGGFQLAKPAAEISVFDVVRAVDGKKPLFDCRNIRTQCALFAPEPPAWATAGHCSIHAVMLEAEQQMEASLKQHTLASISETLTDKAPNDYGEQVIRWFGDKQTLRQNKRQSKALEGQKPCNKR